MFCLAGVDSDWWFSLTWLLKSWDDRSRTDGSLLEQNFQTLTGRERSTSLRSEPGTQPLSSSEAVFFCFLGRIFQRGWVCRSTLAVEFVTESLRFLAGHVDLCGDRCSQLPQRNYSVLLLPLGFETFAFKCVFAAVKLQSKLVSSDICGNAAVVILSSSINLFLSPSLSQPRMNNANGEGITSGWQRCWFLCHGGVYLYLHIKVQLCVWEKKNRK